MRKSRFGDKILLIFMSVILLLGTVGLTLYPAPRFSAAENRNLADFPAFSAVALTDGSYTAALDDYAAERVPFRGIGRRIWSDTERLLLRGETRGVILCRDGSLCRRLAVNEQAYRQNLSALARLSKRLGDVPLTIAVAPRRIDVRSEVLPALYDTAREQAVWETLPAGVVTFLDATKDAQWYRTDHHWTQEGAYFAYARLSRYLGYTPYPHADFTVTKMTESFLGTSAAAAGFSGITPDTVSVFRYTGDESYRVLRDGKPAGFTGLYDTAKLATNDPYALFLGGNCGLLQIDKGEDDPRPLLLVIKDSFANSLFPFLARHYRILAIDPRYCRGGLPTHAKEANAALVLCGMQTLTEQAFFTSLFK